MPSYDEFLRVTAELVGRRVDPDRPVRATDHIQNDLGLDSLAVMELVNDLEERFDVSINSELFAHIETVGDVARALSTLEPAALPAP